MLMLTLKRGCVSRRHEKGRIIAPTSKFIFMKKFFLSICAVAMATTGMAQDASQPQGSWYLGSGDATELLQIFSHDCVGLDATVGYAVADDIVVTAQAGFGGAFDALDLSIGGQYFMGDYYVGLNLNDPINDLGLDLNAGRYIDFKDVLYITPQLNLNSLTGDPVMNITIGMGARF